MTRHPTPASQGPATTDLDVIRIYRGIAPLDAPTCAVDKAARAVLTSEQAAQTLFADLVDTFRQAEIGVVQKARQ